MSGTPSAVPDAEPKLVVMSLRTMPLSVSTLTPFEPSAGNGPPVSSGISASCRRRAVPPVAAVVVAAAVLAVVPGELLDDVPQPASGGEAAHGEELQGPPAAHQRRQVEREAAVVIVDLPRLRVNLLRHLVAHLTSSLAMPERRPDGCGSGR